jgi:transcription elongation factor Elf1
MKPREEIEMATTSEKTVFDNLYCPKCGESEAQIMMDLSMIGELKCESCEDTFLIGEATKKAEERLAAWKAVERLVEFARQLAAE